jgi:hypothetical protein
VTKCLSRRVSWWLTGSLCALRLRRNVEGVGMWLSGKSRMGTLVGRWERRRNLLKFRRIRN